ncbi:FtsH protease activity modulator HflK [Pelagibius sp. Alg239-R121]|uniref:FtsH protease activity modulator HflK n=1 Tax=Pelagibius sp. Alg239-R121 TaxID=2993448 RepID=UPI0024A662E4|nr:FtsH protease activity modulator HflK [Pelagibius sp. Alg239-R121]
MPWENKGGGGPWGGGSGGGGNGNGGGPWGGRGGGGGGPSGPKPPDIEDLIRKSQDKVKDMLPGSGGLNGSIIAVIAVLAFAVWFGFGGFYRVESNQQGVELVFGKWVNTTLPGLNWNWPYPIGSVETPGVTNIQQTDIGFTNLGRSDNSSAKRDVPQESLMLTGDQNIIDIDMTVQWKISDAGEYLFNVRDPEQTVKIAAESALREIIGQTDIQPALTEARQDVQVQTRNLLQELLNEYKAGIEITVVQLQEVQAPGAVTDAFDDVARAIQDLNRLRNEADRYRNDVLPKARGEAQKMIQGAQAYKERLENEAEGEAQRFLSVYEAYKQNPEVTKRRMFLETIQNVMSKTDKVIMDNNAGGGAVPYLPLNELRGNSAPRN